MPIFLFLFLLFFAQNALADLILDGDEQAIALLKPYLPKDAKRSQYRVLANEILATQGYFSPSISFKRQDNRDLKMTVLLGKRVKIQQVHIAIDNEKNEEMSPEQLSEFLKLWPLPENSFFNQDLWSAGKQNILNALLSKRYARAQLVNSLADINTEDSSARLYLYYKTGPAYKMGNMQTKGFYRYSQKHIERYRKHLTKGSVYDLKNISDFQNALQASPYFQTARIQILPEQAQDITDSNGKPTGEKTLPYLLEVVENPGHIFGSNMGYSTNTGARIGAQYQTANFLNRALSFESAVRLEEKQQAIMADIFFLPRPNQHQMAIGTINEHSRIEGLNIARYALGIQDIWQKKNIERRVYLTWQKEHYRTRQESRIRKSKALAPGYQWTWRKTDHPTNPERGYVLQANIDAASKAILSQQNFVRLYVRGLHFLTFNPKNQMLLRYEIGRTFSAKKDGVPQEYLFRTGGTNSVRGYTYKNLGEKEGSATLGAQHLFVASIEWIHWFLPQWGIASFVDVGNAWDDSINLHTGAGLGARWKSPAGPLGVDIAYGFKTQKLEMHFSLNIPF